MWRRLSTALRGQVAEKHALAFLKKQGLTYRARNYACAAGEIDLIMMDADVLVFVEVRLRSCLSHGGAVESVDLFKRRRLEKAAQHYLCCYNLMERTPCRFDILALRPSNSNRDVFVPDWIKDAFGA